MQLILSWQNDWLEARKLGLSDSVLWGKYYEIHESWEYLEDHPIY